MVVVGIDVGGTFTDLFMLDAANGRFRTAKVPSYRGHEAKGFLNGLTALGGAAGIDSIVHGTTVGTNTLLERRGAKIGVITTRGFRDTLGNAPPRPPPHLGPVGRFRSDRRSRHAP